MVQLSYIFEFSLHFVVWVIHKVGPDKKYKLAWNSQTPASTFYVLGYWELNIYVIGYSEIQNWIQRCTEIGFPLRNISWLSSQMTSSKRPRIMPFFFILMHKVALHIFLLWIKKILGCLKVLTSFPSKKKSKKVLRQATTPSLVF